MDASSTLPRAKRGVCISRVLRRAVVSASEVIHPKRVPFSLRNRLKANQNLLLLAGRDRKDSRAQHPLPHPFDQRRVALPSDDLLVHAARFIGAVGLAGHELTVDLELQILEGGVLRKREDVVSLADGIAAVHEPLIDLISQHPIDETNVDIGAGAHDGRLPNGTGEGQGLRRADPDSRHRADAVPGQENPLRRSG